MAAAPPGLDQLIDRFDASAFDAPTGRARLRLRVEDVGDWDFVIRGGTWRLEPADRNLRADARLCADRATWARVARDLRGGMNAFRGGRAGDPRRPPPRRGLPRRHEREPRARPARARAGADGDGQHRGRPRRAPGRRAGRDAPRARRHQGLLPPDRRGAGRRVSGPRDRPAGVRRLGQAAARRLRPALLRPRGVRLHGRVRDRARAPDRQLDGRPRGVRGRLPQPRARRPDRRADAGAGVAARPPLDAARARRCGRSSGCIQITPRGR